MVAPNTARRKAAVQKKAHEVLAWLHHLDDATLATLARETLAELDEREKTRAREQLIRAQAATMDDDGDGAPE